MTTCGGPPSSEGSHEHVVGPTPGPHASLWSWLVGALLRRGDNLRGKRALVGTRCERERASRLLHGSSVSLPGSVQPGWALIPSREPRVQYHGNAVTGMRKQLFSLSRVNEWSGDIEAGWLHAWAVISWPMGPGWARMWAAPSTRDRQPWCGSARPACRRPPHRLYSWSTSRQARWIPLQFSQVWETQLTVNIAMLRSG